MKKNKILSFILAAVMLLTLTFSISVSAAVASYKTKEIDVSFVKTNWTLEDAPEMLELYSLTYDETSGSTVCTRTKIENNTGVTFSSSNPDVIEVSANGTVTPKNLGYSIVTITYNSVSRKVILFCQNAYQQGISKDGKSSVTKYEGETVNDPFALPFKETITDEESGDETEVEIYPQVWKASDGKANYDWYPGVTFVNYWFYDDGTKTVKTKFSVQGGSSNNDPNRYVIANGDYYRNYKGGGTDEKKLPRTGMGWHQATVIITNDAEAEGKYTWTYYLDGQLHYEGEHGGDKAWVLRIYKDMYYKDVYAGTYTQHFNVEQRITEHNSLENISTQVSPTIFFTNPLAIGDADINTLIDIKDASGNAVPFSATLDNAKVYIDFANELNANTSYTITLSENIKNVYGISLPEASRTITFKTASNKVSDIVGNQYILLSEKNIDMSTFSNKAEGTTANELVATNIATYDVSLGTGYTNEALLSVDKYTIKFKYYVDNFDSLNNFGRLQMKASDGNKWLTGTYATGTRGKDINVRFPIRYLDESGNIAVDNNHKIISYGDITKFEGEYCEVTYDINVNRALSDIKNTTVKMTIVGKDGYKVTSKETFPTAGGSSIFKDLNLMEFILVKSETLKVKDMTVYMMQKKVTDVNFSLTGISASDEEPIENITDLKGDNVTFSYTVTNNKLTAGTDKYIVTIAVYDTETNKIVAVNNSGLLTAGDVATAVPGNMVINVPGDAPDTLAAYAYIWDGYTSMKPLADKADLFEK